MAPVGQAWTQAGSPAHRWQAVAAGGTSIGHKGMLLAARALAEGAAEQLNFVRRAGLAAVDGAAVIAVELDAPPQDWKAQVLAATGAQPVAVQSIPMDPRHNAKVDRIRLLQRLS